MKRPAPPTSVLMGQLIQHLQIWRTPAAIIEPSGPEEQKPIPAAAIDFSWNPWDQLKNLRLWMEEILHQKKLRGFFIFYPGIYGTINMFQPRCRISSSVLLHHIRPLLNRQHRQLRARRVAELGGFCWLSLWNPCASACSVEVLPWIVSQLENVKVGPSQKGYSQGTLDYFCWET